MNNNIALPYDGVLKQPKAMFVPPTRVHSWAGLRNSIDCPVERVRSYFHPGQVDEFNKGVASMGHMLANIFIQNMIEYATVVIPGGIDHNDIQAEIPISYTSAGIDSNTHIDLVVDLADNDELDGVYEIKTTSDKNLKPRPENYRQVYRQMHIARMSKDTYLQKMNWYIVVIGKAGNSSGWVSDRFECEYTTEVEEYCKLDWENTDALVKLHNSGMIDLLDDDDVRQYCLCGNCLYVPRETIINDEIEKVVDEYARLVYSKRILDGNLQTSREKLCDFNLEAGKYATGSGTSFTVTSNGQYRIL